MYRIIQTTDNKYIGMELEDVSKEIIFPDGFIMEPQYVKIMLDTVEVGNPNYIMVLRKE